MALHFSPHGAWQLFIYLFLHVAWVGKNRNTYEELQIIKASSVYFLLWSVTSQISSMLNTATPKTGGNSIFLTTGKKSTNDLMVMYMRVS